MNQANIPTEMSGDLYDRGVVYVDLPGGTLVEGKLERGTDEYEKLLARVELPEGWKVIRADMTASNAFIEGISEKPYTGPRSTKTRIIRRGGAVTPEEADAVVKAITQAMGKAAAADEYLPFSQVIQRQKPGTGKFEIGDVYWWEHPDPKFKEYSKEVIVAGEEVNGKIPTYSFTVKGIDTAGVPPKTAIPELTPKEELKIKAEEKTPTAKESRQDLVEADREPEAHREKGRGGTVSKRVFQEVPESHSRRPSP